MSKIQEAIRASRKLAKKPGLGVQTGRFKKQDFEAPKAAPLHLELQLEAKQPAVQSMLRSAGVQVARNGSAAVKLAGTPAAPQLR